MATFKTFEDIEVWKMAFEYAVEIYKITDNDNFLRDMRFQGQIRASAGSIMDNIAEGYERDGVKEFVQFIRKVRVVSQEASCIEHLPSNI